MGDDAVARGQEIFQRFRSLSTNNDADADLFANLLALNFEEATPDFGDEEKIDLQTIDPEAIARGEELLQRFLALPQNEEEEEEYGDGESFWNLFALDFNDSAPEL